MIRFLFGGCLVGGCTRSCDCRTTCARVHMSMHFQVCACLELSPPTPNPELQVLLLQAQGNDWNEELLFQVPHDHPEMQRLEGRYKKCASRIHALPQASEVTKMLLGVITAKGGPASDVARKLDRTCLKTFHVNLMCSVGGLAPSLVVELANGSRAVVLDVTPDVVKLDANSMLAGKKLVFEIELAGIEGST